MKPDEKQKSENTNHGEVSDTQPKMKLSRQKTPLTPQEMVSMIEGLVTLAREQGYQVGIADSGQGLRLAFPVASYDGTNFVPREAE